MIKTTKTFIMLTALLSTFNGFSMNNQIKSINNEKRVQKESIKLNELTTKSETNQLLKSKEFELLWTKKEVLSKDEIQLAQLHYFTLNGDVTKNAIQLIPLLKSLSVKNNSNTLQALLPLLNILLESQDISVNFDTLKKLFKEEKIMSESSQKTDLFKNILVTLFGCSSVVYIKNLDIKPEFQNQKLGQKLASKLFVDVIKTNPKSILCWFAIPEGGLEKKEQLYRFYKRFGAVIREDLAGFSYIDARKWAPLLQKWGIGLKSKL